MAKGDYLTRDRWGEPADVFERKAKEWLEEHAGTEGNSVMKSLGDLLRSFSMGGSNNPGRPVPPHGAGP